MVSHPDGGWILPLLGIHAKINNDAKIMAMVDGRRLNLISFGRSRGFY
jgi:hypothetical protein